MKDQTTRRSLRGAIYTRVSTDQGLEQDFNSLDAQREACEAYIKSQAHEGWRLVRDRYDDGGFSGGSMDRPALQKLLADVQVRRIDVIVVYKVAVQREAELLLYHRCSAELSALPSLGSGQGSFPPPALPALNGSTNPSAICVRRRWPSRVRRWHGIVAPTAFADFPCCTPFMSRWDRWLRFSLASPTTATFPVILAGRLPHWLFRDPMRRW
jgi:hypothetical protein